MISKPRSLYISKSDTDIADGKWQTSDTAGSESPGKKLDIKLKESSSFSMLKVCDSSPQALRPEDHSCELSPQPVMVSERTPEPERPVSSENFLASNDVDIWGHDITTSTQRKMSVLKTDSGVTTPLQEDESVQIIGTAYVAENVDVTRKSKPPPVIMPKHEVDGGFFPRGRKTTSPPPLSSHKSMSKSRSIAGESALPVPIRAQLRTDVDSPTSLIGRPLFSDEPSSLDKIAQLEKEIEELKSARWEAPSICETMDRILVGKPYCLDWYKSHSEKIALLDAAIATNDGNCIMAVLLFFKKSVNQSILLDMLQKSPIALRHYASYLKQLGGTTELINLYKRLNENERLVDLKIQQCEVVQCPLERYSMIEECHTLFTSSPELKADARHLEDYARLTQKQRMIEESEGLPRNRPTLLFQSMVTTLLYCCRYHRNKEETNTASPVALRRKFNIAEKQYFQMYLLALCLDDDWDTIGTLETSTTKRFFSKKKKTPINFERVIKTVARKNMQLSSQTLTKCLAKVDSLELRLQLATEVGMYDVGLDCLKQLKDREQVRGYINVIPVKRRWEYQKEIESLLANTHIKWK